MESSRKNPIILLVLILLFAYGLRVMVLASADISNDEALTYLRVFNFFEVQTPWTPVLRPRHLVHTLLLQGWLPFADHEMAIRYPSVLFGVLSIAVAYQVGRKLDGERVGLLATVMLSVLPLHVYYSHYLKQYAILAFLAMVALWALLTVTRGGSTHRRLALIAYPVSVVLLTSLHIFMSVWIAVQSLYLIIVWWFKRERDLLVMWIAAQAGVFMTAMALLIPDLLQEGGTLENFKRPELAALQEFINRGLGTQSFFGGDFSPVPDLILWGVMLALLAAFVIPLVRERETDRLGRVALLVGLVFIPPLLFFSVSHVWRAMYAVRYVVLSIWTLTLLASLVLARFRYGWASLIVAGYLIVASVYNVGQYHVDSRGYSPYEQWHEPLTYLQEHIQEGDYVVCRKTAICTLYGRHLDFAYAVDKDAIKDQINWTDADALHSAVQSNERTWVFWARRWRPGPEQLLAEQPGVVMLEHVEYPWMDLYLYAYDDSATGP
ncbi:MAG: hypothetical protein GYB64_11245 [Chloroflexi bacterium]|nr:hypothetical protein [Chloroflexota bacterium]